jgi:hypothetical protein
MSDLKKTEPITQENLPEALKDGRITQAEVDRIWGLTEFVSAQTPIETRMLLVRAQELGIPLTPHEELLVRLLFDMRALMTKDESKFAHLVAGTETIVKTLQNVNPLVRRLERQEMMIDSLSEQLNRAESKIDALMEAMHEVGTGLTIRKEVLHGGDEEAEFLAQTAAEAINQPLDLEPTEETYDGNVGSAWDPKNPAKEPIKLPTPSEEYEKQSKEFRERILKHS